ncbi:LysR family transcriptional regulator [Pseudomonas sp. UBA1879]|uniref:LysR family transcriptional regulator n=1 Tax=Pseudomonas sp. UBA1879 TaxID=1947305 RepID=UPI0025CDCDF4|nr:LysR family transcriptional regulator [Pseudomonas sp. UBA1879]
MHGFDLDQLKTLVAAVDAGSLTAAVQLRFRSQSALSEQLNKLEEAAGERLLVRSKSGVTPTAAGQRLVAHAREILALSDAAWRDMHDVPLAGEVHIGISDYFRPSQLAQLLARIALHYPGLRMRTQIDKSDNIAAAHGSGSLDLAIIMRASGSEYPFASEARTLRTERLLWATSRDKPIAVKDTVVELALLSETCSLHRLVRSKLDACDLPHVVAYVASGVAGLQAAVVAGIGIACLNESAFIEADMVEVSGIPLPPLPTADMVLLPVINGSGKVRERLTAMGDIIAATLTT